MPWASFGISSAAVDSSTFRARSRVKALVGQAGAPHGALCNIIALITFCARAAADLLIVRLVQVQSAHVYVASEFGGWQARVLRWLAQHFDEAANSFAKEASSGAIEQVQCWHSIHCRFRAQGWLLVGVICVLRQGLHVGPAMSDGSTDESVCPAVCR